METNEKILKPEEKLDFHIRELICCDNDRNIYPGKLIRGTDYFWKAI